MSFLSSSKEHDLILNISSGSVYGTVIETGKNTTPTILLTHESRFPIKKGITSDSLVQHMLGALHTVIGELGKKHKKKIKTAHVVFSSPWFSSISKKLSLHKEEPFLITEKIVSKLTEEPIQAISKNNRSGNTIVIEQALSDIKLNGYETATPFGREAKMLDLSLYVSSSPAEINKKIESEIYPIIHPGSIEFHTFPFVAQHVIQSLFSPKSDFACIDIGNEISDVLIVRRGSIHSLASFPIGTNHLARNIAMGFETEPELASSIINMYATDVAEASVKEKIKKLVEAFGEEWNANLTTALNESAASHTEFMPQQAYVVSSTNTEKIFAEVVKAQIANVTTLTHENLSQFIHIQNVETPNVFAILEAIYLGVYFSKHIK